MEELEVIMFDEITDYHEKFYGLTVRQWLFSILIVITVVPTYIFLPKLPFINENIASYIVIAEAAILGFLGFIKINELPAEKIVPYLYRHYFCFGKTIKYIPDAEWEEQHTKNKKGNNNPKTCPDIIEEKPEVEDKKIVKNKKPSDRELKKAKKQEKLLKKAMDKFGEIEEKADIAIINNDEIIDKTIKEDKESVEQIIEPVIDNTIDKETKTAISKVVESTVANNKDNSESVDSVDNILSAILTSNLNPDEKQKMIQVLMNGNK